MWRTIAGMVWLLVIGGSGLGGKSLAQQQPAFKLIHSFGGTGDGIAPSSGVVFDPKGNLYGMTSVGGSLGYGTVYELSPQKDGTWTETILHSFPILTPRRMVRSPRVEWRSIQQGTFTVLPLGAVPTNGGRFLS